MTQREWMMIVVCCSKRSQAWIEYEKEVIEERRMDQQIRQHGMQLRSWK